VPPAERPSAAAVVTTGVGIVLLAWIVWSAGPQQIWTGLRQVGWGLVAIIAIAGLRFAVRTVAWIRCLEPPHTLRFVDAFVAVVCGDALGNATPLGPLVSEPAKVAFVRRHVPLAVAFTALTIENLFYTLSVAAMIAAGIVALLLRGGLVRELQLVAELGIVVVFAIFAAATWVVMRRPALLSRAVALAARVLPGTWLHGRLEKARRLEDDIYTFAARRRQSVPAIVAIELTFHALGVLEFYFTLWLLLGTPPPVVTAFILETANRLITVLFKFVPMQQLGLNDAGTWLVAQALGIDPQIAFTLAVVKRARMLFWQLAGTALLVRHGMTTSRILHDPELNDEQRGHSVTTRSNHAGLPLPPK
jgi:Lysylphosphatidylglycerol synthase TM region